MSQCIVKDCPAEALYVLLTQTYSMARIATLATAAPEVVLNREIRLTGGEPIVRGTPVPYLCHEHAKAREKRS